MGKAEDRARINRIQADMLVLSKNAEPQKSHIQNHMCSSSRSSLCSSRKEDTQNGTRLRDETKRRRQCQLSTDLQLSTRKRGIPLNFDHDEGWSCVGAPSYSSQRSRSSTDLSVTSICTARSTLSCPVRRSEMQSIIHSIRQQRERTDERSSIIASSTVSPRDFEEQKRRLMAKWDALNTKRKENIRIRKEASRTSRFCSET